MGVNGYISPGLSAISTYLCQSIATWGTKAYLDRIDDWNKGQRKIIDKCKPQVGAVVVHSDVYLNGVDYHSSALYDFELHVQTDHPDPISERVREAIEFGTYVAESSWEYDLDPDKPAESAAHEQINAYRYGRIGLFV